MFFVFLPFDLFFSPFHQLEQEKTFYFALDAWRVFRGSSRQSLRIFGTWDKACWLFSFFPRDFAPAVRPSPSSIGVRPCLLILKLSPPFLLSSSITRPSFASIALVFGARGRPVVVACSAWVALLFCLLAFHSVDDLFFSIR